MSLGDSWGTSSAEHTIPLPCDQLMPQASIRLYRAITIHAPAALVFRWLCQLKLAPYSYDLIDNLGRQSPRELTPGLEQLAVGERFMTIFRLRSFTVGEQITLQAHRTAVTYAVIAQESGCRLVGRVLFSPPGPPPLAALSGRALAVGDLVMMRRQLLTLKQLAERDAARPQQ